MAEETAPTDYPARTAPTAPARTTRGTGASDSNVGILVALLLVIAIIGVMYGIGRISGNENARDNAISKAASDMGNAASQMGNAAENAAKTVDRN